MSQKNKKKGPRTPSRRKTPTPQKRFRKEIYDYVYVGHPPEKGLNVEPPDLLKLPNTYIAYYDLPIEWFPRLGVALREFQETQSPLAALETFLFANKAKVYPHLAVMDFLAKAIEEYFEGKGKKPLEKCIGLIAEQGQRKIFTKRSLEGRDGFLCSQVYILMTLFEVSLDEAANMVRFLPDSLSDFRLKELWGESKHWKKQRAQLKYFRHEDYLKWDEQTRTQFLGRFPLYSLPPRLEPFHPDHSPQ